MLRRRARAVRAIVCLAALFAGILPVSVRAQNENLPNANLRGANYQDANLQNANLQRANLQNADLQGANLQGANLRGANLRGANLQGANLQGADLRGANLRGADLQTANLQNANLLGTNLFGANLFGANLLGARRSTPEALALATPVPTPSAKLTPARLPAVAPAKSPSPAATARISVPVRVVARQKQLPAAVPSPPPTPAPLPSPQPTPAPIAAPPPSPAPSLNIAHDEFRAGNAFDPASDPQAQRAIALLSMQSCATRAPEIVAQVTPTPYPSGSPPIPAAPLAPGQLYATPFPTSSPVTPPPIPTPTPRATASAGPTSLVRPSATPSIVPAGSPTPSPSPIPSAPALRPGYVAVIADRFVGNALKQGTPGDAIGNVHIFYQDEILVGERAHYDGFKTISVTGSPYIVNNTNTSIVYADRIEFDTIAQRAELINGRGESSQGVERGLVYFSASDLRSDEHGVAHGDFANVTTCDRPRAGYHLTGRTLDVFPGDRLIITKAVLWLGAAAVFYLPKVVIPLRRVEDERQRPSFFPEIGYNAYQGFYIKARLAFGRDQYYYGYYRIEFYSRQGLGLGYTGYLAPKNGKRQSSFDYYQIHDRRVQQTTVNFNAQDTENFSQKTRGHFGFSYNSNFGPLVNLPPNQAFNAQLLHSGSRATQTYTFAHSAIGGQANTDNFGFTENRVLGTTLQNNLAVNFNSSRTNYGGLASANSSGTFNDLLHWSNKIADYTLTYDKSFARTPFGINKEPELLVRPYLFLHHFAIPITSTFTIGNYNEPQTPLSTSRADLNFVFGPALYHVMRSDFSATVNMHQFAYGTGDMKASIQQAVSLSTPIGNHIVNAITYGASTYNGPAFVPFALMDQQPRTNYKNAIDVLRFFNSDYYNLSLNFTTSFNRLAQPVQYQFAARPSRRSYVTLGGSFVPGSGQGFSTTNLQFITPFGGGATLQFIGDIDWKNKARIINKSIYYSRIIGDCYEIQAQYNQATRQVNITLSVLAFPSRAASFGINSTGPIIPTSFNGSF